ncbi:MAG: TRAP transporter small permease subunit [Deltaproteobacteria bacterium]|nr:TRAP transporter small permease subunit [Deltaproteobacteria bacterium]
MPDDGQERFMWVDRLFGFVDRVNTWVGTVASYLVLVAIGTIAYEVTARYVFNSPTKWVTELNIYMLCAYVLLSGGFALLEGQHVRVDLFWLRLSDKRKALADLFTSVLFFAFAVALVWKGAEMTLRSFTGGTTSPEAMAWPLYPSQAMVPIGGFLLGIQGLAKFWRDLRIVRKGGA